VRRRFSFGGTASAVAVIVAFLVVIPEGDLLLLFVINEAEEFFLHGTLQYSHIVIFLHW
jgi:hypothetical protein